MKKMNKDLSIWMKSGETEVINDVVLSRGELGYDTLKNELKVGDGKSKFIELKGLSGSGNGGKKFITTDRQTCFPPINEAGRQPGTEMLWQNRIYIPDNCFLCGFIMSNMESISSDYNVTTNYISLSELQAQVDYYNENDNWKTQYNGGLTSFCICPVDNFINYAVIIILGWTMPNSLGYGNPPCLIPVFEEYTITDQKLEPEPEQPDSEYGYGY